MEFLFDSIKAVSVLSCGHTIHSSCCDEMARHGNYYCPVCHKTFLKPSAAKSLWEQYDRAVAETPMPQEYRETQVEILCNDCGSRSQCMFHIVGMKCTSCGSYNTTRS
jgi:RING finger/CHY zinc finger protein 1